jgi:hypothetical protein
MTERQKKKKRKKEQEIEDGRMERRENDVRRGKEAGDRCSNQTKL